MVFSFFRARFYPGGPSGRSVIWSSHANAGPWRPALHTDAKATERLWSGRTLAPARAHFATDCSTRGVPYLGPQVGGHPVRGTSTTWVWPTPLTGTPQGHFPAFISDGMGNVLLLTGVARRQVHPARHQVHDDRSPGRGLLQGRFAGDRVPADGVGAMCMVPEDVLKGVE